MKIFKKANDKETLSREPRQHSSVDHLLFCFVKEAEAAEEEAEAETQA